MYFIFIIAVFLHLFAVRLLRFDIKLAGDGPWKVSEHLMYKFFLSAAPINCSNFETPLVLAVNVWLWLAINVWFVS